MQPFITNHSGLRILVPLPLWDNLALECPGGKPEPSYPLNSQEPLPVCIGGANNWA